MDGWLIMDVSQEHEMKKAKSSIEFEPRDRLSELPDSLILKIFEFMRMRDVVRTSILSGRWKNLWTVTPCLCFHSGNNDKLRSFVNRALLCWRGPRVHKFQVAGAVFDASLFTEMDLWLRFAVEHGVEVLEVCFRTAAGLNPPRVDYCAPMCLYSCSSLQRLSLTLQFFNLEEIKVNVRWNRLKSLEIDCFVVTQHAVGQILCGSPLLESFVLFFHGEGNDLDLSFRSSSLKKLKIVKGPHYGTPINNTGLRIWTPNLVMLSIFGFKFNSCLLMDVSSLVRVELFLGGKPFVVRDILSRILPAIQNVKELALSESCIEVLGAMKIESLLSPFSNVTFLELNNYRFAEHEKIVGLVEIFPKLKTLAVGYKGGYVDPESMVKFKPAPSESFLLELKTFSVSWTGEDFLIFPFIKIVLRYASKLEKMVFRVKRTVPSNNLLLATKKLLKMPRSSPTSKLIIHEY